MSILQPSGGGRPWLLYAAVLGGGAGLVVLLMKGAGGGGSEESGSELLSPRATIALGSLTHQMNLQQQSLDEGFDDIVSLLPDLQGLADSVDTSLLEQREFSIEEANRFRSLLGASTDYLSLYSQASSVAAAQARGSRPKDIAKRARILETYPGLEDAKKAFQDLLVASAADAGDGNATQFSVGGD